MSDLAAHWLLDPAIVFLNHGSFGACPRPVLEEQTRLREALERQPVEFLVRRLPDLLDAARARLAGFLDADPEGLVPVPNATAGVNAVLRSLELAAGDEVLVTDHAYQACRNALDHVAARSGARVVVARVPFPLVSSDSVVDAVLAALTPRTHVALLDHVTSPTGLVFPVERLVRELDSRGVDALIDGAHAPGMLPLSISAIGPAYYTGNAHKWLCAPKGAGFLWVREDRRARLRPLSISHGATVRRPGRSRLHDEFDWTGTDDPTAFLCVPRAIEWMGALLPGGWEELRSTNRSTALAARDVLAAALGIEAPAPASMIGSLAALPLPDAPGDTTGRHAGAATGERIGPPPAALYTDALHDRLLAEHGIEVPIVPWPAPPRRLVRISAQIYNRPEQYEHLAAALGQTLC